MAFFQSLSWLVVFRYRPVTVAGNATATVGNGGNVRHSRKSRALSFGSALHGAADAMLPSELSVKSPVSINTPTVDLTFSRDQPLVCGVAHA
jgi:hypothetical protein